MESDVTLITGFTLATRRDPFPHPVHNTRWYRVTPILALPLVATAKLTPSWLEPEHAAMRSPCVSEKEKIKCN